MIIDSIGVQLKPIDYETIANKTVVGTLALTGCHPSVPQVLMTLLEIIIG